MSELNSFFAKIHIKKDKFYEFLTAQPSQQLLNENWIAWWGSKEMYGKHELTQEQIYIYSAPTNGEIINGWKTYEQSLTFSDYDEENEIWNFSIILFSENYSEMLEMLSFIKNIGSFKKENNDDFAIVYDYFWGGNEVNAFISFKEKQGFFDPAIQTKSDLNTDTLAYADSHLAKKWKEYEENGSMDKFD